ncbi:MAG: hydroxymethylbilane synthase [Dethiosulfovibrio peptidovorans]|nr:MAG: hydroxymethylbilane synthase [Dethiosulfovibrio peptidovorans]
MNRKYSLMVAMDATLGPVLVVGGGDVGERKIRTLLSAQFDVTLVSPHATMGLLSLVSRKQITWHQRCAQPEDFQRHRLAVLAVPREETEKLLKMAEGSCCLMDCSGAGDLGNWSLVAQFRTEENLIGVGSFGTAPLSSADLKMNLQSWLAGSRKRPVLFSRKSALAKAQTLEVAQAFQQQGVPVEIKTLTTCGDRDLTRHLSTFGGFGAFVKCLEEALLEGRGDGAVHSLKDVPSVLPEGLELVAVLPRSSSADLLISKQPEGLDGLPEGALVGTSSIRRAAQLAAIRPDLRCTLVRGNVHTRLARLESGEVDALILAQAGLNRLGITPENTCTLPFLPAPCQGIIAVEARQGTLLARQAAAINHRPTWLVALAERELLKDLQVGCHVPFAACASWEGPSMILRAQTLTPDGKGFVFERRWSVNDDAQARDMGRAMAEEIRRHPEASVMLERRP